VRSCANDHYFCRGCLEKHININVRKCPGCRADIPTTNLESSRILNNLISHFRVRCPNGKTPMGVKNGFRDKEQTEEDQPLPKKQKSSVMDLSPPSECCDWKGTLQELHKHPTDCGLQEIKCRFKQCGSLVKRNKLTDHEATCLQRQVPCSMCASLFPFAIFEAHLLACPKRPVKCPNGCADAAITFEGIASHRRACNLEHLSCLWKDLVGCGHQCTREAMVAHSQDFAIHVQGLVQTVKDLKRRTENLETELNNVRYNIEFMWEIPKFTIAKARYNSSEFQAFGHTVRLCIEKTDDYHHGVYLEMISRCPAKLGYKFTIAIFDKN
jgi:hypothetical protein